MTLYLYRVGETAPLLAIEHAASYTADHVTAEDGAVYGPFAADCELSGTADCAGTLRADWRGANAGAEDVTLELLAEHEERICMLEIMAG